MQNMEDLKNSNLGKVQESALVDITSVEIDITKSKEERLRDYLQQIKNPYCFRCGKSIVKISFTETEDTLQHKLMQYLHSNPAI